MKVEKCNMEKGCNVKGLDNERVLEDVHVFKTFPHAAAKKDQTV